MNAARAFQFRIGTLLLAMAWVGLISLGLRSPTTIWAATIGVLTHLAIITSVLVAIYRADRIRADRSGERR